LVQENGETTTKILFAEEKSQLSLVERMQRLENKSQSSLVGT
jgi:2-iminoacetate synthase ThiH